VSRLRIMPISFDAACQFVDYYHRHHRAPRGHKFSIGCHAGDGWLVGVAIVGRPVARALNDGYTVEVTRVATDGTRNACSALYGAANRAARRPPWCATRVVTYTQAGESGASLRGAGWQVVARLRPRRGWDTPGRRRLNRNGGVARLRWEAPAVGGAR
jgi:hypothetical protein